MDYDKNKVDEMVLALLLLTLHDGCRAWKGHDWGAMERLYETTINPHSLSENKMTDHRSRLAPFAELGVACFVGKCDMRRQFGAEFIEQVRLYELVMIGNVKRRAFG